MKNKLFVGSSGIKIGIFIVFFILIIGPEIHIFKTYGPGIGITVNILTIISCLCIVIPVTILILELIDLRSKRKKFKESNIKKTVDNYDDYSMFDDRPIYKMFGNQMFNDYPIIYNKKFSDKTTISLFKGTFIEAYYYKDHSIMEYTPFIVPALLMFMSGVKAYMILFFFVPDATLDYNIFPW